MDQQTVEFSYTGADADIVFLIGVHEFESLEQLYFGYEQLFQTAMTVTFHSFEPQIGTFKLDASGSSSLSESMSLLLQMMAWPLPPDAATNLLQAVEQATDSLQSLATSAETFETVAWLMRNGARRVRRPTASVSTINTRSRGPQSPSTETFAQALNKPAETMVSRVPDIHSRPGIPGARSTKRRHHNGQKQQTSQPPTTKSTGEPTDGVETNIGSLKYQPSGVGPSSGG